MQTTTNYGLKKPDAATDNVDIAVINDNMDTIDSALKDKATIASPVLTGTPKAPTQSTNDNSTAIATTAFVKATIAALIGSAPTLLNTLQEIDAAINNDPNLYNDIMTAINNTLSTAESYTNGITGALSSLSTTTKNSIVLAINELLTDIGTLSSLSTAAKANLVAAVNEVLSAHNSHAADDTKHVGYAATTNSGNAYSVTIPNLTALTDGLVIRVKFNAASTGTITINPNSLGTKSIVDYFGNTVTNVRANLPAHLCYESSSGNFILLGKGGGGDAQPTDVRINKKFTNDNGQQVGSLADNGALGATLTTQGQSYTIPAGITTGGSVTVNIANLSASTVMSGQVVGGIAGTGGQSTAGDVVDYEDTTSQLASGSSINTYYKFSHTYTMNIVGTIRVKFTVTNGNTTGNTTPYNYYLYKNGVAIGSWNSQGLSGTSLTCTQDVTVNKGDYFNFYWMSTSGSPYNATITDVKICSSSNIVTQS